MKICVAQTKPIKGDILQNINCHQRLIEIAVTQHADIIIFPELSLTGYEPELAKELATTTDDTRLDTFQQLSDHHRVTIGVGIPTKQDGNACISMVIFQPNQTRKLYSKKYLHPDEEPFFISGKSTCSIDGNMIALAICYELSIPEHATSAFESGAKIYIASVVKALHNIDKALKRLSEIAAAYKMTVLMSNCAGISGGDVCAGKSSVWNNEGMLLAQLNDTDEGILIYDTVTQQVTTM